MPAPGEDDLLSSDAARSMMPGFARSRPAPSPAPADTRCSGIELELVVVNPVRALQDVDTRPGSGDRQFILQVRGRPASRLTDEELRRVLALRWTYRWQLPAGLRPPAPPG